jgi:hypothetical protein
VLLHASHSRHSACQNVAPRRVPLIGEGTNLTPCLTHKLIKETRALRMPVTCCRNRPVHVLDGSGNGSPVAVGHRYPVAPLPKSSEAAFGRPPGFKVEPLVSSGRDPLTRPVLLVAPLYQMDALRRDGLTGGLEKNVKER